jgi:hypothetical protein
MEELTARLLFNRSLGHFELLEKGSNNVICSAGKDRRQAAWLHVRHEIGRERAEELQRFAAHHPQLETRIQRAGLLFAQQKVGLADWKNPNDYIVRSQSDSAKRYAVHIPVDHPGDWTCTVIAATFPESRGHYTCPDIANGAPSTRHGKRCKHMIVASLHRRWMWAPWARENGHGPPTKEEAPTAATVEASEAETVAPANASVPQPAAARKLDRTLARYASGDLVELDDLPAFAAFVRHHRRLPHNRAALR